MTLTFKRDTVFWTISMQVAIVNFYLGGFGPGQPLLRADQGTSLTVAGLHGTAMGIASIIAGFVNARLVHIFGRKKLTWLGLILFCVGVFIFVISPPVQLTLFATLLSGLGISTVVNNMVTRLSNHLGPKAPHAIAQASGIASAGYILGTILIGTLAGTSISWRLGLLLVIPVAIGLAIAVRGNLLEEAHVQDASGPQSGKLSRAYWIAWAGFFACICTEFGTTFWAAALLRDRVGSTAAIATLAIVAFGIGMGLGRWFGGLALQRLHLDIQAITLMTIQFAGFIIFWFSHNMLLSLFALFAMGLGVSMQFALVSIRLIALSDGRPDLAMGRSSLAAGLAIALAPFILGLLGDNFGISRAYVMVPILIVFAVASIVFVPTERAQSRGARELQN
ncbi:unannotated protein [freshwater metagenome]|uniref:Unannotated protein n=1 Tax=freshwater metagenome TaxID=449393 RepID=A0A6J7XV08_9ZZZZ|nr:MFS transporter [Actinomycetota bacterium]